MCCPCFNDFTNYIKSFFEKNEEQIKSEMNHLVNDTFLILFVLRFLQKKILYSL